MFRLCLQLGVMHPDYLEAVLTQRQLDDWFDYAAIEPFGSPVDDQRTGLLVHAIWQSQSNKRVDLQRCIPQWGEPEPLTPEQYKAKAMRAYLGNGGK